jgi:hypothetical protein
MEIELDHIFYTLIPFKGYGVRAWSKRDVVSEVEQAFKGWFSPYEQALVRTGTELRAIVKSPRGYVHLARIFLGEKLDELKRSGVVSHIASIPEDLALNKKLSLELVDKTMMNYTALNGIGIGEVSPMKLEMFEEGKDRDLEYLKITVDEEKARKILTGIGKPYGRVIIIHKRDVWGRVKLAYALTKLLMIYGLTEYMIVLDRPLDNVLIEFEKIVLILDKMIPLKQVGEWTVMKIATEEVKGKEFDVDKTIEIIYGDKKKLNP